MNINAVNINFILLLLFPLMFVLGNAAVNFYILFSLFFLLFFKKKILEIIKNNKKTSVFIFFSYLYFLCNAIFIAKNIGSVIFAFGLVKFIILFFFIKISFANLKDKINQILLYWVFFLFFLTFDAFVQLFSGTNIIGIPSQLISNDSTFSCNDSLITKLLNNIFFFNFKSCPTFLITSRLSGFFGTELVIGGFISSFFSILYGATIHSKKIIISNIFLVSSFFVVLFSGERMSFIIIVSSIILFLLANFSIKHFVSFVLLLFLGFFIIYQSPGSSNRYHEINRINSKFINNVSSDLPYYSIWNLAIYNFKNNIFLGMGIKNFRNSCNTAVNKNFVESNFGTNACKNHTHNLYLEILTETGLVGMFIFLFVFFNIFFKTLKIYLLNRGNCIAVASLISIVVILNPLKVSGAIFSTFYGSLFFFIVFFSYFMSKFYTKDKLNNL